MTSNQGPFLNDITNVVDVLDNNGFTLMERLQLAE